jgi:hypothetical protein
MSWNGRTMSEKDHIRMIQRLLFQTFVSQREGHCDKRAFAFFPILNSEQSGFFESKEERKREREREKKEWKRNGEGHE